MPYKRAGRKIYSKSIGRWRLKQTARSIDNAKKAMRLLNMLENKKRGKLKW